MRELDKLPFEGINVNGRVYETFIIEPPVFMPKLMAECEALGIQIKAMRFDTLEDILSIEFIRLVNCLGMGAAKLFSDELMIPIKGQLVHLRPQDLPWLLSHSNGYVFPRADSIVLGGSVEWGVDDCQDDVETCERILQDNQSFFKS